MLCIIIINFARTIMGMAQRAWHHHIICFWGIFGSLVLLLFYLGFLWQREVSMFALPPLIPMWNAYTSMFEGQPSALQNSVCCKRLFVCRYVCMQNHMNHMYTTYTSYGIYIYDDIYFYPQIPYTHMNMIISIRMHKTESISPFNTRWCQPSDLVLRFYRRNPKSQEWFRRTAGWDSIWLSVSFCFFCFFSVAILLQNVEAQLRIYKAIYVWLHL